MQYNKLLPMLMQRKKITSSLPTIYKSLEFSFDITKSIANLVNVKFSIVESFEILVDNRIDMIIIPKLDSGDAKIKSTSNG